MVANEEFWAQLHDVDKMEAGPSYMECDAEGAEDGYVMDMDEAAAQQQGWDVPAATLEPPSTVEETRRPRAPTYNQERIEQLLALPTFNEASNKRKRSDTYAGHSKIMTFESWMEAAEEERKKKEKLEAAAARKAATAANRAAREARKAAAAAGKPFGQNTAKEKAAAKSSWEKQEQELRTVLWPARGEEENPARLALLQRFRPL